MVVPGPGAAGADQDRNGATTQPANRHLQIEAGRLFGRKQMFIREIVKGASASRVIGVLCSAVLVVMPASVHAADIAWHETSQLKYDSPPDYRREGTAIFKTGEKASLVIVGKIDVTDDKGMRPFGAQYSLRLDDGSTITLQIAGTQSDTTGAQSGSGEFASGTGRFQGITGKVTFVGHLSSSVSEKDWVGSYSLPNK
jgi:hypothetical protein